MSNCTTYENKSEEFCQIPDFTLIYCTIESGKHNIKESGTFPIGSIQ